jgi:hypothetical protein
VPLCASFVPWNFRRCVVIRRVKSLSHWFLLAFPCMGSEGLGTNVKAR